MGVIFTSMAIDPSKPYIYVAGTQLRAYNYETGEMVKEFTGYIADAATKIDVSADGRYLATLNSGKAYLKVWDLSTMELIRDVQLWDDYLPTDWWCESDDVQFSKLNSDVVYYSGYFPISHPKGVQSGIHKFIISSTTYTDDITKSGYSGKIIMFDNENGVLIYGADICFSDLIEQKVELLTSPEIEYPLVVKTVLSEKYGLFIGFSGQYIGAIKYDRGTSVESPTKEITISPNPTGSFVNVGLECSDPQINYQISDVNGLLISEGLAQSHSGSLQIDFSPYPAGIYFLTINCGDSPLTYKVIRE
jgi:WD40 repeat protein